MHSSYPSAFRPPSRSWLHFLSISFTWAQGFFSFFLESTPPTIDAEEKDLQKHSPRGILSKMQLNGLANFITSMTSFFSFFWGFSLLRSLSPSSGMGYEGPLWEGRFKISGTPYGLFHDFRSFHPTRFPTSLCGEYCRLQFLDEVNKCGKTALGF